MTKTQELKFNSIVACDIFDDATLERLKESLECKEEGFDEEKATNHLTAIQLAIAIERHVDKTIFGHCVEADWRPISKNSGNATVSLIITSLTAIEGEAVKMLIEMEKLADNIVFAKRQDGRISVNFGFMKIVPKPENMSAS